MWTSTLQALGGVFTLAGVIFAAVWSARSATRAKRMETEAAPYAALADRVSRLEDQVSRLLGEQYVDRAYIRTLLEWIADHLPAARPPAPPPWFTGPWPPPPSSDPDDHR